MGKKSSEIRHLLEDLAVENSEKALESLYFSYCDRIMRYIFMYVKSDEIAQELTSDVFFTIWENRKILLEIKEFDPYIYKIAKFKSLNYLRDIKSVRIDLDEIPIDLFAKTETTPEDDLISKEQIDSINNAIEALPSKCKVAFKLVREDNMKYKDAAEHLNISIKTLEAHLASAMKKIKEKLNMN